MATCHLNNKNMKRHTLKNAIDIVGLHHIFTMCVHCEKNVKKAIENQNDVIVNFESVSDCHVIGVCHD